MRTRERAQEAATAPKRGEPTHRVTAPPVPPGAGRPLDLHTRAQLEPRFGADFGAVRIHTGPAAARSADGLAANAFTVGSDITFAAGRYAPDTASGHRLLAHELTHVVQQRRAGDARQMAATVSDPRDTDESEADAVADRVLAGHAAGPITAPPAAVQRTISATPVETMKPNAQVCLVHLHGDEANSRQAAVDLQGTFCANLVDLPTTTRNVNVTGLPGGRSCAFDPNRVFTPAGIAGHALRCGPPNAAAANPQVTAWANGTLVPAISRCRGGGGGSLNDGSLPVVAFHNNAVPTGGGGLSIAAYRPGGSEANATETDPARLRGGASTGPAPANPSALPRGVPHADPHNFLLTTDPGDFAAFRGTFNVVLQENTLGSGSSLADDGSLSVALRGARYVNVEARDKAFAGRPSAAFIENLAMGTEVLTAMGISRTCQPPAGAGHRDPAAGGEPGAGVFDRAVQFVQRLVDELGRVLRQTGTMPKPLPRETVPAPPPVGCRVFGSQAELDVQKARFTSMLSAMSDTAVIEWIVGRAAPPRAVTHEVATQRNCMIDALRRSARQSGSPISMTGRTAVASGYRSFADQERIWARKFRFDAGHGSFGRITEAARRACPALGTAVEWNPDEPSGSHRACWARLSDEQRQREILQTSSAPGMSRHHWGTDVDLWSTSPADFDAGAPLADEYAWLMRNASTYGFIQSFDALSTFMRLGYAEERWHWSYHPAAQALLEWADTHRGAIDTRLTTLWGSQPQYSFLAGHWEEFVFNVAQSGRF